MPTSNFLIFDQNKANMIGDEAYQTSAQRLNGVQSGVASSMLNNKFAYQVSLVAYAIAQIMNQNGIDATDTMAVSQFVNNLSSTFLQKVVDKATAAEATAGTSDVKWMSPAKVKQAIQNSAGSWKLLQEYKVAGTFNWVAPDILGGNKPYDAGILLIEGGWSGDSVARYQSSASSELYPGGKAGRCYNFIQQITPGATYVCRVGKGGNSVTSTISNPPSGTNSLGLQGELSSFGGFTPSFSVNDIAQNPLKSALTKTENINLFGGISFFQSNINYAILGNFVLAFNAFTGLPCVGAGESSVLNAADTRVQGRGYDIKSGKGGGTAQAIYKTNIGNYTAQGGIGTLPGCGGGAASCQLNNGSSGGKVTAISGKGADGAVMIYVKAK